VKVYPIEKTGNLFFDLEVNKAENPLLAGFNLGDYGNFCHFTSITDPMIEQLPLISVMG
jgi:hypothetical protein